MKLSEELTSITEKLKKNYLKRLTEKLTISFLKEIKPGDSVLIRENTDQKKPRIWTLFTQC